MNVEKTGIAVAAATTDEIARFEVESFTEMGLQIKNAGNTNPLDAFEIWFKTSTNSPEEKLAGISTDYTSPSYPIRSATNLTTLAAGSTGHVFMSVAGIKTIILKASSGTGATTAEVYAQLD